MNRLYFSDILLTNLLNCQIYIKNKKLFLKKNTRRHFIIIIFLSGFGTASFYGILHPSMSRGLSILTYLILLKYFILHEHHSKRYIEVHITDPDHNEKKYLPTFCK